MERLTFLAFMAFCTIFPFRLDGQSAVGAKAGVNLSGFFSNEAANIESYMKAGASAGYFYRHTFHECHAVEVDVMFQYTGSGIQRPTNDKSVEYRCLGMEIPVYGMLQAKIKHSTLYAGLGPFASVGLISRIEDKDGRRIDPYKKNKSTKETDIYRWNFGFGFIVGYELGFGLQINATCHLGMRNLLNDHANDATMTTQMLGLELGYRF